MKKIIALGLAACLAVTCFVSCDDTPPVETTESYVKKYDVEDGVLNSCIGQADENGVYTVPDTITMIGESAFAGDETLKEIIIGPNVKAIGAGAFQYCTSLKKVTIAEGVESIGSFAFYACSSLEEISLPSTVERLEPYTFYVCEALESLSLQHIRYIDDYAMWYCVALEEVTLSAELTGIGSWAFSQCQKLETIDIENCEKLEAIGDYAFSGCVMLTSFTVPEGTRDIGKLAFYGCSRLTDVTIPGTVEMVDFAAFNYTPWYQEYSEDYLIVGDGVLIKCTVHPLYLDLSGKGIKYIGSAFWNAELSGSASEYGYKYASELESVEIPEGVTAIGVSAFEGCYKLQTVTLPSTLERIEESAFYVYTDGYSSQTAVSLENCTRLEYVGNYAFYGCQGMDEIWLPDSVDYVGAYAFAVTGAYDGFLESVKDAEDAQFFVVGDGVLITAYVPNGVTSVEIPEGIKIVGGAALCGWDTAYIPADDEELSISGRSKYNLSYKVQQLSLPSTVETICDSAFFRMTKIQEIVLPDSLKYIGASAFAYCENLSELTGGMNVEQVGDNAFSYCTSIGSFHFYPNTVKIGNGVFAGCSALVTVEFPEELAYPGEDMFTDGCTALREIYLAPEARPRIYTIVGSITQDVRVRYYIDD